MDKRTVFGLLVVGCAAVGLVGWAVYLKIEVTPYEEAARLRHEANEFNKDVGYGVVSGLPDIWDGSCAILTKVVAAELRSKDTEVYDPRTRSALAEAKESVYGAIMLRWELYPILFLRWPEWCNDKTGQQMLAWE